jgi:hypothetical protein
VNVLTGAAVVTAQDTQTDANSHGTHVAGIAAAHSHSGAPGVAPECTILSAKVIDVHGHTCATRVLAALQWAAQRRADVINLSLANIYRPEDEPDPQEDLLASAVSAFCRGHPNILVVGTMGNTAVSFAEDPERYVQHCTTFTSPACVQGNPSLLPLSLPLLPSSISLLESHLNEPCI